MPKKSKSFVDLSIHTICRAGLKMMEGTIQAVEFIDAHSQALREFADRLSSQSEWWRQGIAPDIEGIYPKKVLPDNFESNGGDNSLAA